MNDDGYPAFAILAGLALLLIGAMAFCANSEQVGIALFGDVNQSIVYRADPVLTAVLFLVVCLAVAIVAGGAFGGGRRHE